ncbi:ferrochelatase [Aliikangiella coralliicola]|uniref:Ferrochelatase n=1 Tax=Aliikangiella coralliicola TaxID=2592383 RepID=A0A545U8I8_9GAMM|nr:ferrochelatase [Aliikangiella coralliicola]TQV85781.1 ferrochelatase [Aliikangiella coralliicola]
MSERKYGVLLVNLGTPAEPTVPAVRSFLKDFLSDRRVVDLPRIIWLPILYGVILTFRPKKVTKNYQKIWFEDGSPLMVYSREQQAALQMILDQTDNAANDEINKENNTCGIKVELGMTYGQPSIKQAVNNLETWGADEIIVLPLYPQYSFTTTAPVTDQLELITAESGREFSVVSDYHDEVNYIQALAETVKAAGTFNVDEDNNQSIQQNNSQKETGQEQADHEHTKPFDKLILSFHGIPKRYVVNGDPYQAQCEKTAERLAEELGLKPTQWEIAYQSRVGREEWLTPYLDQRMTQLADEGVHNILVICPGFSVDCLETLEEIAMENRDIFLENGGQQFQYIDALNAQPAHIQMMKSLVNQQIQKLNTKKPA